MKVVSKKLKFFVLLLLYLPVYSFGEEWSLVFKDTGEGNWLDYWFLEGDKASVKNSSEGMVFSAGPIPNEQASHAVLWTKKSFTGDVRIEYEYTRMDSMTEANSVNILYIQATGIGTKKSPINIFLSTEQRKVPWMKYYFLDMNALQISYACSGPKRSNYVSARQYPAKDVKSFHKMTQIKPVYNNVNIFKPGETWHITLKKEAQQLVFTAKRKGQVHTYSWDRSSFSPINEGRIGFRHMWARSSRYRNIKIFVKNEAE